MLKIATIALLFISFVVLCYLLFISGRLLRRAQQQALEEKRQQRHSQQKNAQKKQSKSSHSTGKGSKHP